MQILTKNIIYSVTNRKSAFSSANQIIVSNLIQQFHNHFRNERNSYIAPLLTEQGLLNYTSRFAKTAINIEYDEVQRKTHFMAIKKALNSKKQYTPQSCADICESLVSFKFEGEENALLQKMRIYAKENAKIFSSKQADKFMLNYKYIMTQRAFGSVKFVDIKLKPPVGQVQQINEKIKHIFKKSSIKQFKIDWSIKKQIVFEIDISGMKRMIKIICFNKQNNKFEDIQVLSNHICLDASKSIQIVIVGDEKQNSNTIESQILQKQLLNTSNSHKPFPRLFIEKQVSFFDKLASNILQRINSTSKQKLNAVITDNMQYLNQILENSSEDELKEIFGYIKFNIFHLQLHKLLHLANRANKQKIDHLQTINYLRQFEEQEHMLYNIISSVELKSKSIVNLLSQKQLKSINVYCSTSQVVRIINFIIKHKNQSTVQPTTTDENKDSKVLVNKMALASLIYQIPLNLPILTNHLSLYRRMMHPLTHQFRFN